MARRTLAQSSNVTFLEESFRADVIPPNALCLAIHVIYLLEMKAIDDLIALPEKGTDLIVVLDSPDSVFSQVWEKTAPDYLKKCEYVIDGITRKYQGHVYDEVVCSQVLKPSERMDRQIRLAVLSTICYRKYDEMNEALKAHTLNVLDSHTNEAGTAIDCRSLMLSVPGRR